ncbi:MAG: ATP-binding cassette domain-containing protein, partial [Clostridia bacterium]|nr:ATP-binding cassette domain-containing protein [Clostridia bacterium]
LSGGQKQRVAISRAVLRHPEILIFDDSTSALDLGTEAKLRNALNTEFEGTTVIMIAQRIASVMHADRIAVIENGRITAFDNHDNLMKTSATYRDIYSSQMKSNGGDAE